MPQDSRIAPLDWAELVREAVRRRKRDGLTQKQHAALAGVSVPVMIAFDKGRTNISLGRALAILDVVGLAERARRDRLGDWRRDCERRFETVVSDAHIPPDHPARFPHGYYDAAYLIDDGLLDLDAGRLAERILPVVTRRARLTGWPPFWVPERDAIAPRVLDDETIECWLGAPGIERAFADAAHADFWRIDVHGRAYVRRGYQEDGLDGTPPGTLMDTGLPIIRAAEIVGHAVALARAASASERPAIECELRWTGLMGRDLLSWANPRRIGPDPGDFVARADACTSRVSIALGSEEPDLASIVLSAVRPLFERFGYHDLEETAVSRVLDDLRPVASALRRGGVTSG